MKETDPLVTDDRAVIRVPSVFTLLRQGGVVLQNEGSTARDHLANERTFLAWIRTALAITGVGIGLLKWDGISMGAGYLVLALGVIVLFSATWRYLNVMQQLSENRFEPNVKSALMVVTIIVVVVVALLLLEVTHRL